MPTVLCAVAVALLSTGCAGAPAPPACAMPPDDMAWIEKSVTAWRFAANAISGISTLERFEAMFFSADCILSSRTVLRSDEPPAWTTRTHQGTLTLPDSEEMPAGVVSTTIETDDGAFFVMSTPSVWRAGKVDGGALGLETLMTAVLIHEGTHVSQFSTYGRRISAFVAQHSLPESFNDDSLQTQFRDDAEFSQSVSRETELLLAAAGASSRTEALRLAREARLMMQARVARWFLGENAYWHEAEDLWLTMEGSAQWVGYTWLTHRQGAALPQDVAMPGFATRGRFWSQKQGLAIALALDRLDDAGAWKRRAFGDGSQTLLQMLDAQLMSPGIGGVWRNGPGYDSGLSPRAMRRGPLEW